jgi:hypothetical protein
MALCATLLALGVERETCGEAALRDEYHRNRCPLLESRG